jgi:hypothetical protein
VAGQRLVHGGVLPGQADQLTDLVGVVDHVVAADGGVPAVRPDQRGQYPDGGGLAGAVRPEQAEHRTGANLEVYARQRDGVAVPLGQAFGNDRVVHGSYSGWPG